MKPSDFYLGVVNFLGVLVPGVVFLFLRGFQPTVWSEIEPPIPGWLIYGGVAYLIGQLLLAATESLNRSVRRFKGWPLGSLPEEVCRFRNAASAKLERLAGIKPDSGQQCGGSE